MQDKKYDVVVWGATGFTGKLVAEYLYEKYGVNKDLKWAIAGRDQDKLKTISSNFGMVDIPILVADSHDRNSLDEMTKQTKVVCTTVGPYALYGSKLVASCIDNKADYCDLAGEVQWIRKMIDTHHEAAKQAGVKIVNCCGIDSIPSDMGVYFLQKEAKKRIGEFCTRIRLRVKAFKGGFSGGTYASLNNVIAEASADKTILKTLTNPYGLNPNPNHAGKDGKDLSTVKFEKETNSWITPFVMAAINAKIVRRSHALAGFPYGQDYKYDEAIMTGPGIKGRFKSLGNAFTLGMMMLARPGSLLKKGVDRFLPKPGEGPSREERENGFFSFDIFGVTLGGRKYKVNVKGDRDPGYGSTAKMLGECAVCLALDKDELPTIVGILTPSIAMGDNLINRLQENAGLTFTAKALS